MGPRVQELRESLDRVYPRYGYPNDMLVRLNVLRARVVDVASVPVYDVGEVSGLKIRRVLFTMSWLLLKVSGVALLEKTIETTRPKYADYVARTNAFFPAPPKH